MGEKFPSGPTPVYPPRDWTCPKCGKYHSTPHWKDGRQMDGFVKEESKSESGCRSVSDPQYYLLHGVPPPMFCPHCGWELEIKVFEQAVS
jgi:hypothetical protein